MTSWMSMLVPAGTEPSPVVAVAVSVAVSVSGIPVLESAVASAVSLVVVPVSGSVGVLVGVRGASPAGSAGETAGVMVWGWVILVTNSSAMSCPRERLSPVAVAVLAYRL